MESANLCQAWEQARKARCLDSIDRVCKEQGLCEKAREVREPVERRLGNCGQRIHYPLSYWCGHGAPHRVPECHQLW